MFLCFSLKKAFCPLFLCHLYLHLYQQLTYYLCCLYPTYQQHWCFFAALPMPEIDSIKMVFLLRPREATSKARAGGAGCLRCCTPEPMLLQLGEKSTWSSIQTRLPSRLLALPCLAWPRLASPCLHSNLKKDLWKPRGWVGGAGLDPMKEDSNFCTVHVWGARSWGGLTCCSGWGGTCCSDSIPLEPQVLPRLVVRGVGGWGVGKGLNLHKQHNHCIQDACTLRA